MKLNKNIITLSIIFVLTLIVFSFNLIKNNRLSEFSNKFVSLHQKVTNFYQPFFYDSSLKVPLEIESVQYESNYEVKKFKRFINDFAPRHPHARLTSFLGNKDSTSLFMFTSTGKSFFINLTDNNVERLSNNLKSIIDYPDFFIPYPDDRHGVKDLLVSNKGEFFLSVTDRDIVGNCTYIKVLYSEGIKNNKISDFKLLFKSECVDLNMGQFHDNGAHMLGGRISFLTDQSKLIVSLGMLNNFNLPQSDNNSYGKILEFPFDLDNPIKNGINDQRVKILVKGIRNPQGLDYHDNMVIMSSHGPKGGDVINLINYEESLTKVKNYGFPIVSYGTHYDGSYSFSEDEIGLDVALKKDNKAPDYAPFYQDPKKYGFEEALKFYTPSIGPSQILFHKNKIILSSMGYRKSFGQESIHFYEFDKKEIIDSTIIKIGGRVRDIEKVGKEIFFWDESNSILGSITER